MQDKVVLVVDDDLTLLEMYVERIKAEGAIVVSAKDGEEACLQATENHPHVILLDIMMPKVNGFDVLKKLKGNSETSEIPVIVLSALSDPAKEKMAFDLGAADFMVKSEVLPIDVIEKIRKYISLENPATGY